MNVTDIEWATHTWNPCTGCTPVSEGCKNCYAKRFANRFRGRCGYPAEDPFRVTCHENRMEEPFHLRKPRLIFVCSMGDLFHPHVPTAFQERVCHIINLLPRHKFLVLTKRPSLMLYHDEHSTLIFCSHAYVGVTIENQLQTHRAGTLSAVRAAGRFISVEPMLTPVTLPGAYLDEIDWVICGGERGPGARPMKVEWARALRKQCREAGIPFFFKKLSSHSSSLPAIPRDLFVRQVPRPLKRFFNRSKP